MRSRLAALVWRFKTEVWWYYVCPYPPGTTFTYLHNRNGEVCGRVLVLPDGRTIWRGYDR